MARDQPQWQQCDFFMRQMIWFVELYAPQLHAMLTNEPAFDELCRVWAKSQER
ncbi:MAG: hypothetical protein KIS67_10255 [Verrucomicrobiae bacterium]|nr:hypothetical protein [Verrucomicrobiae bacterium]